MVHEAEAPKELSLALDQECFCFILLTYNCSNDLSVSQPLFDCPPPAYIIATSRKG